MIFYFVGGAVVLFVVIFFVVPVIKHGVYLKSDIPAPVNDMVKEGGIDWVSDEIVCTLNSYVANTYSGLLFRWYIEGYGLIPRWSKVHRMIEERYATLLSEKVDL